MGRNAACPRCQSRDLETRPPFTREIETNRIDAEGITRRLERWRRQYCPECELVFATLDRVRTEEIEPEHIDGGEPA